MTATRRIALAWYSYAYLREALPIYPVYAIMIGAHGVDALQLSVLFIVWSGAALVCEVPAGMLADRYSRKWLLVASGAIKGGAFIVWWLVPDFTGYLAGFVIWGASSSLVSGTAESYLYDALAGRGEGDAFARVYGRGMAAASLGIATALASGGFIAERSYDLPLALSLAATWASAIIVVIAFREPARRAGGARVSLTGALTAAVGEIRGNHAIVRIVAMFATLVTAYGVVDEYIGPLFNEKPGFDLGDIGVAYAVIFAARTLGMAYAHRLRIDSLSSVSLTFGLACIGLALAPCVGGVGLVAAVAGYFAGSSAAEVRLQTRLQHEIESRARATVTSFAKMSEYACGTFFYLLIGALANVASFQVALAATALVCAAIAALFVAVNRGL
jgi:MFS family permease